MLKNILKNRMRFELGIARFGVQHFTSGLPVSVASSCLRFSGLSWVVTVTFQNIAACKLLFFVKNKGQWNAKSGPKVGDGKVAM